ncbi:hypothetical protein IFT48_23420 [Pseudomonas fluorescens]|uniref:sulfotransferase-like domain-containing protein n=1 Tax=Pseudomonas TaxID=286 RepID=UPI001904DA3A|nr:MULTISPECIES: hypothetical protein [Pseudomonas]MBD8092945.1 hypothetical protein [Pseudomonas fluorescens]MBD8718953.1 hypothetical protein [Pseudomonas fluorescens]MDL2187127.1 hypothetical protein [Pseudomonas sp. ChxA]
MQHRLIVMWAPPRSLSTAFVRVIAARGDFTVVHEPLCDLSACGEYKHPQQENSSPPLNSPTALFDYIQTLRSHSAVFIKDTCEFDYRHLLAGTPYLREAQHVFMLRNPEKVINSHYHVNPQLTCNEVGYQNLAQLYDSVKAESIHAPLFVDADDLLDNPDAAISHFCSEANLQHLPTALQWESGHLDVWERTRHWHLDAANSTRIAPIERQYSTRVDNHPMLNEFYLENMPYYQYLKNQRETVKNNTLSLAGDC